jgi:hypothetical protein
VLWERPGGMGSGMKSHLFKVFALSTTRGERQERRCNHYCTFMIRADQKIIQGQ